MNIRQYIFLKFFWAANMIWQTKAQEWFWRNNNNNMLRWLSGGWGDKIYKR